MNNVNMANMNAMAGQVAGAMPMAMNNGVMPNAAQQMPQSQTQTHRNMLNTYIYDYFLKEGFYEVARAMLQEDSLLVQTQKDSPGGRQNGAGDDPMDTDSKDDMKARPADLPVANIPISSESCFLYEWFGLFWEMLNGHRLKPGGNSQVNTYIQHTQQANRMKQSAQQEMLRQMRPDQMQFNPAMMRNMPNGMQMANKNNLARTAMANNQNNPQAMAMMQQQAKQNPMQRDPSDMDGNRRPASPGSVDNAPSPSKRPRLEGQAPFNQPQPGMMPNGRPQQQGMPGQPGFQNFANQPPGGQKNPIATYSQNLQQHHGQQMPNKAMANPGPPQQGSPMMQPGPNAADISSLYNANEFPAGGIRPGAPGNGQGGGSNHALQDYQMQLMLLEQQNKKRLMMARQEQDSMGSMPRGDGPAGPGGPGGPPGPNGQAFPDTSPQGPRAGASPNPSEQMKRATPQMNPVGIPSPLPEGAQSRGSPNPMNFMQGGNMDPSMAGNQAAFFKNMNGMDPNMVNAAHMAGGMRPPPSSHPNQPFNGQVTPQMMAARQAQGGQAGPNQMQWQGGPNGAMIQGPQNPVQGTPQQRAAQMPPPSAPGAGGNPANGRTQPSSPATSNAAPPTPQQSTKANPKKKDTKNTKKGAAAKKSNANTGATPAAEASQDQETPTPATPITPANPAANFAKNGQNAAAQPVPNVQGTAPSAPAPSAPQAHPDPNAFNMDNNGSMSFEISNLDFANPIDSGNVLQDFDFDSFLHDGNDGTDSFDFTSNFDMPGGEIATE